MHTSPLDPHEAERRFSEMLAQAGLPPFESSHHDAAEQYLELTWSHGFSLQIGLTDGVLEPIEDWERDAILGLPVYALPPEPVHIVVPGLPDDPRDVPEIPGVVVHRCPPLHPDDLWVVDGIRVTSPSRTLIDMAECSTLHELRELFAAARARGLLDADEMRAARARVEWRPSLAMLDRVIAEFCG